MVKILGNLEQSWMAYRKFFTVIISAILIAAIPPMIVTGLGFLVASDFSINEASALISDTYFSQPTYSWEQKTLDPALESWWFLGFAIISALMSMYFLAGTYGVCLGAIKGKTSLDAFFESMSAKGVSLVIAKILLGLIFAGIFGIVLVTGIIFAAMAGIVSGGYSAASAVFLAFIIVGIIIGIAVAPFFTLISPSVVSGRGGVNAIKESISLGKKNYWDLLGLLVIILGFLAVDVLLSFLNNWVGIIFSFAFVSPMMALLLSSFYLERSGKNKILESKPKIKKAKVIKRKLK